ncbi:MAG: UDP-N-acetylmuramoyl-L-alanine--D-glutamate ligase [bacterium]|nr:UDP-N-acetylmuramoyl-L-alanine--D-glutamate ligase [bacterium]
MKLNDLKNKKILILGFGREGKDTFLFLRKLFPKKIIGIADKLENIKKPDENTSLHSGKNYLNFLKDYDVVIKSPGIPFKILPKSSLKKIITQTDVFFDNCPGEIIGVTGTKGKSTTTSLIYGILKAGKIKAHLVGNIGKPVLNFLFSASPKDVYVYELSSHQLYNLKKSPHIAVMLNIYPEHLDYYRNFKEYVNAKTNIARYQTKNDYLVYNSADKIVKEIAGKSKTESRNSETKVKKRISFSSPAKKIPVKGEYYELDKNAARAVGKIFKIPGKIIDKAVEKFKYLPHRLELVGTFRGITFYNDALATIPEATMAAIETLGKRVQTIMLGGFDRNIDFKNLAKKVLESKIKTIILFPTTGEKIWREIIKKAKSRGLPNHFFVSNMEDAVKLAYQHTKPGEICLLSTASSSFSIFKNYEEKGNLFKKFVKKYGKK